MSASMADGEQPCSFFPFGRELGERGSMHAFAMHAVQDGQDDDKLII